MYNLQEIRERVNSLIDEGEAILALLKKEDRKPSEQEQQRLDALYGTEDQEGLIAAAEA